MWGQLTSQLAFSTFDQKTGSKKKGVRILGQVVQEEPLCNDDELIAPLEHLAAQEETVIRDQVGGPDLEENCSGYGCGVLWAPAPWTTEAAIQHLKDIAETFGSQWTVEHLLSDLTATLLPLSTNGCSVSRWHQVCSVVRTLYRSFLATTDVAFIRSEINGRRSRRIVLFAFFCADAVGGGLWAFWCENGVPSSPAAPQAGLGLQFFLQSFIVLDIQLISIQNSSKIPMG
eukprot:Skav212641  [mRNA]  locus=scaffold681:35295:55347:+ [translate_table: standard]